MSGGAAKNIGGGASLGLLAGLALAPFTGGLSLAAAGAIGAGVGATAGAIKNETVDKPIEKAKKAMDSLQPSEIKKTVIPLIDSEAVNKARSNSLLNIQKRSGRASTLLTNQSQTNNTFG